MTTTTKHVLADRSNQPNDLVASGNQIDMIFKQGQKALSLRAQKLWHLLIKQAGVRLDANTTHTMPLADLYASGIGHMTLAERVETIRELQTTLVEIRVPSPKVKGRVRVISGALLAHVERDEDDRGDIEWEFSRVVRTVFAHSAHWAVLSRRAVMAFESRYSLRLYEIIALRAGLEYKTTETFSVDDIRARLGVPAGKLKPWNDLRRKAIEPAVEEINQLAGFTVNYQVIKRGRSVVAVQLAWHKKSAPALKAAKKELDTSKVGRRARREGTAETVVEAAAPSDAPVTFPAVGSIRYTVWADLARASLPRPTPDIDQVANDFRAWVQTTGKPLRGDHLTGMFTGFCRKQRPAA
jgi:Initiator Replication protein